MADLLSSVIAAHGGLDRWRAVRAIDVTFNFSGGLLDLKGYPGHRRPSVSVDAATPRTVFQRLGDESDDRWIFTPNRVWIERRDGTIVEERSDPRGAFAGNARETPGVPRTWPIFSATPSGTISRRPSSLLGWVSRRESSKHMSKVASPGASSR